MKYTIKKLPHSEIEISVTVSEDKMREYRKKASDEISKEVKIKGFRQGHVPPHILEQYIDKKYIDAHTQEIAIQQTLVEIILKEKLQTVSRPKIKIEKDEPLTYTATIAILPEIEVKDYKSIKIKKEELAVTEEDINKVLSDLRRFGTIYKDIERESKKGDRVEVDFEGFEENGQPVPNTKSTNHPIIIGEEMLVKGFEEQLIGLKKGDKKEFELTFPRDYAKKDFQGKKLKFKIEIKKVEEAAIPEINEALIEKLTGKKQTIEDFKKEIEKNILAKKEQEAKQKQEVDYIEELLKKIKVDLPESLLDEEAEYILEEMKEEISKKGVQFEKFLEQAKTTEDDLRKKYRPEGERRIKVKLALKYLLKEEKIEITDAEVNSELEKIKSLYPPSQNAKIQKDFDNGHLSDQIRNRLALRKLFDTVLVR